MWTEILTAVSLYLILEGVIPFARPDLFRRSVVRISEMNDNELRMAGLVAMAAGLILLFVVR